MKFKWKIIPSGILFAWFCGFNQNNSPHPFRVVIDFYTLKSLSRCGIEMDPLTIPVMCAIIVALNWFFSAAGDLSVTIVSRRNKSRLLRAFESYTLSARVSASAVCLLLYYWRNECPLMRECNAVIKCVCNKYLASNTKKLKMHTNGAHWEDQKETQRTCLPATESDSQRGSQSQKERRACY